MSIRRIESAYATFLDDRKMSAAEMSVLVALAYVANEKRDEDCFPSDSYLKLLTHLGDRTIRLARNNLRSRKIIDWISGGMGRQGGNISNRYRFLFPHLKMPTQRERYQQLGEPPTAQVAVPCGNSCRLTRKEHRIEHRNRSRKIEEWFRYLISSLSLNQGLFISRGKSPRS